MKHLTSTAIVLGISLASSTLSFAQTSPFEVSEDQHQELFEKTQLVKVTTDAQGLKTVEPLNDEDTGFLATRGFTDDLDVQFTGSIGVSSLQGANASLGIIIGHKKGSWNNSTLEGVLVEFRPGLGGAMTGVGYMIRNNQMAFFSSLAVKMDVYQTWSKIDSLTPGQTYIGTSVSLKALLLDASIGVLRHIAGDQNNANWKGNIGIGVGI